MIFLTSTEGDEISQTVVQQIRTSGAPCLSVGGSVPPVSVYKGQTKKWQRLIIQLQQIWIREGVKFLRKCIILSFFFS